MPILVLTSIVLVLFLFKILTIEKVCKVRLFDNFGTVYTAAYKFMFYTLSMFIVGSLRQIIKMLKIKNHVYYALTLARS